MIASLFTTTLLSLAPSSSLGPAPTPWVQDEQEGQEVADKRPEVAELIDTFKDHIKKKGKEDEQAIEVLDRLYQEFEKSGPKDRASIVKALEGSFKAKRTKELSEGVPDDRLYYASATALGDMAPESVKPLMGLIGHKSHRSNLRLQARLAESLGKTEDVRGVDTLMDLLKNKDGEMQAAGADALGYYSAAEEKVRKEIFKGLLDVMMGLKAEKDLDPQDIAAQDRWNLIQGPFLASLKKITGHDENDPEGWQRWWNKNKKADWDAA